MASGVMVIVALATMTYLGWLMSHFDAIWGVEVSDAVWWLRSLW